MANLLLMIAKTCGIVPKRAKIPKNHKTLKPLKKLALRKFTALCRDTKKYPLFLWQNMIE